MGFFGPSASRQNFMRLAAQHGIELPKNEDSFELDCAGRSMTAVFHEYKGNVTFSLVCKIAHATDALFRSQNSTDRFGVRLGIGANTRTSDALFDEHVFATGNSSDPVFKRLLEQEGVRKGALFLLQSGYQSIDFGADNISIARSFGRNFALDKKELDEHLTALEMLLDALPQPAPGEAVSIPWRPESVAVPLFGSLIVLGGFLMVVCSFAYRTLDWQPHITGFGLGLALWAATLFLAARWVRGRTDAFRAWLMTAGLAFVSVPLMTVSMLILLNSLLDNSAPVSHQALVRNKTTSTSSKGRKSYYLTVKSWRPGEKELKLNVDNQRYNTAQVGAPLNVVTQQGAFGFEWRISP